jgi:hypothetical protein
MISQLIQLDFQLKVKIIKGEKLWEEFKFGITEY